MANKVRSRHVEPSFMTRTELKDFDDSLKGGKTGSQALQSRAISTLEHIFFTPNAGTSTSSLFARVEKLKIFILKDFAVKREPQRALALQQAIKIAFMEKYRERIGHKKGFSRSFFTELQSVYNKTIGTLDKDSAGPFPSYEYQYKTDRQDLLKDPRVAILDVILTASKTHQRRNTFYLFHSSLFSDNANESLANEKIHLLPEDLYPLILKHLTPKDFENLFKAFSPKFGQRHRIYPRMIYTLPHVGPHPRVACSAPLRQNINPIVHFIENHLGGSPHEIGKECCSWQLALHNPINMRSMQINFNIREQLVVPEDIQFPRVNRLVIDLDQLAFLNAPAHSLQIVQQMIRACMQNTSLVINNIHPDIPLMHLIHAIKLARSQTPTDPPLQYISHITDLNLCSAPRYTQEDSVLIKIQLPQIIASFQNLQSIAISRIPLETNSFLLVYQSPSLRNVTLTGYHPRFAPVVDSIDLRNADIILPVNQTITTLSLEDFILFPESLIKILGASPQLRHLTLDITFSNPIQLETSINALRVHHNLRFFSLEEHSGLFPVSSFLSAFPNLEEFTYMQKEDSHTQSPYSGEDFQVNGVTFQELKVLNLSRQQITNDNLFYMLRCMPKLTKLVLRHNQSLSDLEDETLFDYPRYEFREMRHLDLACCNIPLTEELLNNIQRVFPRLETLVMGTDVHTAPPFIMFRQETPADTPPPLEAIEQVDAAEVEVTPPYPLKNFSLNRYALADIETLASLLNRFSQIQTLNLDSCVLFHSSFDTLLINTNVKTISWSHNCLTLPCLYLLLNKFPNLEKLTFYSTFQWASSEGRQITIPTMNTAQFEILKRDFPKVVFETGSIAEAPSE